MGCNRGGTSGVRGAVGLGGICRSGRESLVRGRCWAAGLIGVAGVMACMVLMAKGRAGMGESIVFRRRSAEIRRSPRLNFMYEDLLDEAE